jgi:hypothetical protein
MLHAGRLMTEASQLWHWRLDTSVRTQNPCNGCYTVVCKLSSDESTLCGYSGSIEGEKSSSTSLLGTGSQALPHVQCRNTVSACANKRHGGHGTFFFQGGNIVPVTHAPGSERLARGTGAAAVQAGISAEGCSSSPSANWPHPGLVTLGQCGGRGTLAPIRWTEVPRHVVKDARQIPSTPPHTVATPSSSSSSSIQYTLTVALYTSPSNNRDIIVHTSSPWPLPVRTHRTIFHVSRTDNAQRRSARSSPTC